MFQALELVVLIKLTERLKSKTKSINERNTHLTAWNVAQKMICDKRTVTHYTMILLSYIFKIVETDRYALRNKCNNTIPFADKNYLLVSMNRQDSRYENVRPNKLQFYL